MKVKIFGDAIMLVSSLKKEELETAEKFCKEQLILKKKTDEEKAHPVFALALANCGGFNTNGVVFDSTTEDGFACVTLCGCPTNLTQQEKARQFIEQHAKQLTYANELEAQIQEALRTNEELINTVSASVEIVG